MRHVLFEYLLVDNRFTAFRNVLIALRQRSQTRRMWPTRAFYAAGDAF